MNSLLVSLVILGSAPLTEDEQAKVPTSTTLWLCQFCSYSYGWYGHWNFGTNWVSDSQERFANFRGLDESGFYPSMDARMRYRDDSGYWLKADISDPGANRGVIHFEGGKRGGFDWYLSAARTRQELSNNPVSPFTRTENTKLKLPQGWVPASSTKHMSLLQASATGSDLSTQRQSISGGVGIQLRGQWSVDVDYQHSIKTGTRPIGVGAFTVHSALVPAPVDHATSIMEIAANRLLKNGSFRLAWSRYRFSNELKAITVENPFLPVANASIFRTAAEPDNESQSLSMAVSLKPIPPWRLSVLASSGSTKQDESFLPYSINSDFDHLVLPRASLGAGSLMRNSNVTARNSFKLSRSLKLSISLKNQKRQNRVRQDIWTPVITDLALRPDTLNKPYSFKITDIASGLSWHVGKLSLSGGVKQNRRERSFQAVESTRQKSIWSEVDIRSLALASFRIRLEHSDRDLSTYQTVNDPGLVENPLQRKFNLAGRNRDQLTIGIDFNTRSLWSLGFRIRIADDDYDRSTLGLMTSTSESLDLDLSYAPDKRSSTFLFASIEELDSDISGIASTTAIPWGAINKDLFRTIGLGIDRSINERWSLGLSVTSARSTGRISVSDTRYPDLTTRLLNTRLSVLHHGPGRWGWTLSAEHEKFSSRNWQTDSLGLDGVDNILLLGETRPDSNVLLVRALASYHFQ